MSLLRLLLLIYLLAGIGLWLCAIWLHRDSVEKLNSEKDLDANKTFFSIDSFKRIVICTFTPEGLLIHIVTNVFFPKASLLKANFLIRYDEIKSIEMGQMTTTLKLKDTVSAKSLLLRYALGAIATLSDSRWRMYVTSKSTYKAFIEQLNEHSGI